VEPTEDHDIGWQLLAGELYHSASVCLLSLFLNHLVSPLCHQIGTCQLANRLSAHLVCIHKLVWFQMRWHNLNH